VNALVRASISVLLALPLVSCGPSIDLSQALQVEAVSSGWLDAGTVYGKKKLVPAVSVRLTNRSNSTLPILQVNALFRRAGDTDEWGSAFLTAVGSEGLSPRATTQTLALKSELGYTGEESGPDMLHNSRFVDARVDLFARYGSSKWVRIGAYPISRQLIAR
jgi:hypothetical protein